MENKMKKLIILPIILLMSAPAAHAMWWSRKKVSTPASAAIGTTAEPKTAESEESETSEEETSSSEESSSGEETAAGGVTGEQAIASAAEESSLKLGLPEEVRKAFGATLGKFTTDTKLVAALKSGDVEQIKMLVTEDNVTTPLKTSFFGSKKTPLEIVFENESPNKLEIAQILLDKGADKEDLNQFLLPAVQALKTSDDMTEVNWLLAHGAKDVDGKAMAFMKAGREEAAATPEVAAQAEAPAPVVAEPLQVTLESEKVERVEPYLFTPIQHRPAAFSAPRTVRQLTGKPVARVQEVTVEITPVARPVAKQPLRLTPTAKPAAAIPAEARVRVLAPVAKPAPARPKQWPAAPAPARPVEAAVPVELLEPTPAPTAAPVEELGVITAR